MRVDRRLFLKGLVVGAAGLVVPKGLLAEEEPERRFWSLNPTLPDRVVNGDYEEWPIRQIGEDAWETVMLPRSTPFLDKMRVNDASGFHTWDYLQIGEGAGSELVLVTKIVGNELDIIRRVGGT